MALFFTELAARVRGMHRLRYHYDVTLHEVTQIMPALEGVYVELLWHRNQAQAVSEECRVTTGTALLQQQRLSLDFFLEQDDRTHKILPKRCKFTLREAKQRKELGYAELDLAQYHDKGGPSVVTLPIGRGAHPAMLKITIMAKPAFGSEDRGVDTVERCEVENTRCADKDSVDTDSEDSLSAAMDDVSESLPRSAPVSNGSMRRVSGDAHITTTSTGADTTPGTSRQTADSSTVPSALDDDDALSTSPPFVASVQPPTPIGATGTQPALPAAPAPHVEGADQAPVPPRSRSPRPVGLMSMPVDRPRPSVSSQPSTPISKNAIADMTQLVAKLDQEIKEQEEILAQVKRQQKEARHEVETLQYERQDLESILTSLRQQQRVLTEDCERLDRRAEDSKGLIANLKRHASELESHLRPTEKRYRHVKRELEEMRAEKAALSSTVETLRGEIPVARRKWWFAQLQMLSVVLLVAMLFGWLV